MSVNRRSFLKLLLASAAAEAIDVEQLLWIPRAIITVPRMPTVGGINRASYLFWRNGVFDEDLKKEMRRIYLEDCTSDGTIRGLSALL